MEKLEKFQGESRIAVTAGNHGARVAGNGASPETAELTLGLDGRGRPSPHERRYTAFFSGGPMGGWPLGKGDLGEGEKSSRAP